MPNTDILKKNNFHFNKSFGQNFIFDKNLLQSIVRDAEINENTSVLEIGPGAGTLTKILSQNCKRVVAYEIDKNLENILNESLQDCANVKVIYKDIMKVDIKQIEQDIAEDYTIVANLPYYITTPILFKFVEQSKKCKSIIVMVQKEMGERLIAKPNSKDYGAITVSLNYRCNVSITRIVKRNMFVPAPNVDSCIVKLTFEPEKFNIQNLKVLNDLIKYAFAMRRKTLLNNLKGKFELQDEVLLSCIRELGKNDAVRGEALSVEEFVNLSNLINSKKHKL